jgi:4-hydroxybenzoyl-CoA thioesterase
MSEAPALAIFNLEIAVSFGDCDPAGIVFYPNYFRWMDATFHDFLRNHAGGHAALCHELGALGLGLKRCTSTFLSPATNGDRLICAIKEIEWTAKHFDVFYVLSCGDRTIVEGQERRAVFMQAEGRIRAASTTALQRALTTAG